MTLYLYHVLFPTVLFKPLSENKKENVDFFKNLLLKFDNIFRWYCCKNPKVAKSENSQNKKIPLSNRKIKITHSSMIWCKGFRLPLNKCRVFWNNTFSPFKKNGCCLIIKYRKIIKSRFEKFVTLIVFSRGLVSPVSGGNSGRRTTLVKIIIYQAK